MTRTVWNHRPRRRAALALALALTVTACHSSLPNSPSTTLSGIWRGTVEGESAAARSFRVEMEQDGARLTGSLEAQVEFPYGQGHELIGTLEGEVQGDVVTFTVQGTHQYVGKSVSFSGYAWNGNLEGHLASQVEERLKSGRALIVRR